MPLPLTGPVSLAAVNLELGRAPDATIALDDPAVRALAGITTGPIGKADLRGKSATFTHTITTHQLELNLRTYLQGQGWDGISTVAVTVASGIYIWSDTTALPALDMGGAFPGGLTLINKGFIMGKGGDGGYLQSNRTTYVAPQAGGPAIALTGPISIDNTNGYIGGGGGGGAGQSGLPFIIIGNTALYCPGGGGAGGGRGGPANAGNSSDTTLGSFGMGGTIGQTGSVATDANNYAGQTIATHGGAGGASGAVNYAGGAL
jgi:hypothetical protein